MDRRCVRPDSSRGGHPLGRRVTEGESTELGEGGIRCAMVVTAALLLLCRALVAAQTTYTVSNTNDAGAGSLRQAILTSALPTITDPVVIDGTTEPDFSGTPIIELDGTNAGSVNGLRITAANSTVRGLVINRFGLSGVEISGAGATGNLVEGNFIGTDVTGSVDLGNAERGVAIFAASNNTVGGTTAAARNIWAYPEFGVAPI